ncbi:heavy metal-associated isoprenylated plant protein 35-like [Musa acuminata AAA Group]|uniref:heavy metal-associated isoprenylated plant protein 35-like n=1 Tax=Musa acuminata AAA Group TaxID=214697 RepID=UPI0031DA9E8F
MVDAWKFSAGSSKLLGSCGGCSSGRTERSGWKIIMDCFSLAVSPNSCVCVKTQEEEDGLERKSLIKSHVEQVIKIKDVLDGAKTLAFHLEPKTVVLKVSMHCNGCARKIEKHISKMEGVSSFKVDLEKKKVVVVGDITPFEVLESVSKVKFAELWLA